MPDLKNAKKDGAEREVSAACRSSSRRASSERTVAAQWSMLSTQAPVRQSHSLQDGSDASSVPRADKAPNPWARRPGAPAVTQAPAQT